RDWKLIRIIQSRIEEHTASVHLEVRHESVPVRHRSPPGPGVEVHAREAERRRNERGRRLGVRPEGLTVENRFRIELAGPQLRSTRRTVASSTPSSVVNGVRSGASATMAPDVQIATGPAVEPPPDAGRDGIVDHRVAERALNADRAQRPVTLEE